MQIFYSLAHLDAMVPAPSLDLKDLTTKLAALLLVSSGHRVQTLQHLDIDYLILNSSQTKFCFMSKLKHTKDKGTEIIFKAYPQNVNLCAVTHLSTYLRGYSAHQINFSIIH